MTWTREVWAIDFNPRSNLVNVTMPRLRQELRKVGSAAAVRAVEPSSFVLLQDGRER